MRLNGKVAIVTGGARGIGAEVSKSLSAHGAIVVINDLGVALDGTSPDMSPAEQLAAEICTSGKRAEADSTDIGDHEAARAMVESVVLRHGRLDAIVNVAGILRERMIYNMTEDEWDDVIRVHLKGYFNTIKPAAVHWRSVRDDSAQFRIINFTSGAGLWGSIAQANYSAAKAGVVGLTLSCARGLARYGVTANAVAPLASTRMTASIPTNRTSSTHAAAPGPEYVAPLVTYLATEESGWCNGRVLESNGSAVSLYDFIRPVEQISTDGLWTLDDLTRAAEQTLRPAAEATPNPLESRVKS